MYKHIDVKKKPITSAVIFFIMDVSGSMDKHKKFLARSFFFLLYQFIRYKYEKVDLVFISHTTEGKEVNEDDFFKKRFDWWNNDLFWFDKRVRNS
jgi:uncharacterized protein